MLLKADPGSMRCECHLVRPAKSPMSLGLTHLSSEELRQLIGKHIEAIGQLREDFAEQTGMNGERDSATGICYLAYTVAKTGRVPRSEPRTRFDFSQLKERPILSDDTLHWNPPPSNLPAGTPICPHCYRNTGKTNGNASNLGTSTRGTSNRNASNRIPSSRNTSHGSSRQTERDLPPLPQEPPRPQQPAALPPQQEIRVVAPVSDDTSSIYGDHEPQHVVTQPQPKEPELPAPQFNANPERAPEAESTNPGIVIEPPPAQDPLPEQLPEPQPEPEIGPVPKTNSDSGPAEAPPHPPSSFPYNVPDIPLIDGQVPPQSRSPSLYPESDHDLVPDVTSETNGTLLEAPAPWVTRSRRPTAERLPPVITSVEILNHKNQWHSMQVHLDTSLYIPNRHEAGRKEVHYYGIVSLRTLIDELGWPEETLLEDPRFVEIPNGKKFNWNLERHEGVGRVMLTWRVDQSDDEWANAVVPKMTRECIVSREDPCEQGVVLKAMPAAQNA